MRYLSLGLTAVIALIVSCGNDARDVPPAAPPDIAPEVLPKTPPEIEPAVVRTLSASTFSAAKMVGETTWSLQNYADQSETATSGFDDASGTGVSSQPRGGSLVLSVEPNSFFESPKSGNANLTLAFNAFLAGSSYRAQTGTMNIVVRGEIGGNESSLVMNGELTEDQGGYTVKQSEEPNVRVLKIGSRGDGQVTRKISGTIRRTMGKDFTAGDNFNLIINHNNTVVTDLYTNNSLQKRTITGTVDVMDAAGSATARLTYTNVERPTPIACLCPTSGNISMAYVDGGMTKTTTHTFNEVCGEVFITEDNTSVAPMGSLKMSPLPPRYFPVNVTAGGIIKAYWSSCFPRK
jgi:hypothetical protein